MHQPRVVNTELDQGEHGLSLPEEVLTGGVVSVVEGQAIDDIKVKVKKPAFLITYPFGPEKFGNTAHMCTNTRTATAQSGTYGNGLISRS